MGYYIIKMKAEQNHLPKEYDEVIQRTSLGVIEWPTTLRTILEIRAINIKM